MNSVHDTVADASSFRTEARDFLERFTALAGEESDAALLNETILVGGPGGFSTTTRDAYFAGVARRVGEVGTVATPQLVASDTQLLGSNYGLVTATWELPVGAGIRLTADVLLARSAGGPSLLAYLTRQDLLAQLR